MILNNMETRFGVMTNIARVLCFNQNGTNPAVGLSWGGIVFGPLLPVHVNQPLPEPPYRIVTEESEAGELAPVLSMGAFDFKQFIPHCKLGVHEINNDAYILHYSTVAISRVIGERW